MPYQVFRGACTQSPPRAGGRGFIEHNWDWGDIQWWRMWAVTERVWLVRGGNELNEFAPVSLMVIQNLVCSE
jgi:hypothetical protein